MGQHHLRRIGRDSSRDNLEAIGPPTTHQPVLNCATTVFEARVSLTQTPIRRIGRRSPGSQATRSAFVAGHFSVLMQFALFARLVCTQSTTRRTRRCPTQHRRVRKQAGSPEVGNESSDGGADQYSNPDTGLHGIAFAL